MKVKIESEVIQSCLTLSDPVACSLPGSSVHGIFQARVLEWGAILDSAKTCRWMHLNSLANFLCCEPAVLNIALIVFVYKNLANIH